MGKKITAWVIMLLVIMFPFRRAFLSEEPPGIMMMLAFMVFLVGLGVFYYLNSSDSEEEGSGH
jgi:hypothetical protein